MCKRDLTASVILVPPLLPYAFYLCRYMLIWKNWFFHLNSFPCIFYFILYKIKYILAKIRQWHKWYWKSESPLTLDVDHSMPSIPKTAAGWMQGVSTLGKAPAGRQNQTNLPLHSDRKQDSSPKIHWVPCKIMPTPPFWKQSLCTLLKSLWVKKELASMHSPSFLFKSWST